MDFHQLLLSGVGFRRVYFAALESLALPQVIDNALTELDAPRILRPMILRESIPDRAVVAEEEVKRWTAKGGVFASSDDVEFKTPLYGRYLDRLVMWAEFSDGLKAVFVSYPVFGRRRADDNPIPLYSKDRDIFVP